MLCLPEGPPWSVRMLKFWFCGSQMPGKWVSQFSLTALYTRINHTFIHAFLCFIRKEIFDSSYSWFKRMIGRKKGCGRWSPFNPRGCYGPAKNIVTVVQDCDILILLVSAYVMFESKTKWFMNYSIWMDILMSKLLMIFCDKNNRNQ